ncbi:MAG: hypothetical protein LBL87_04580 [Ruminococcus sp.]|jgi:hypothetical protein|nr:hypothetical protein [Ruminococcus sp.]
MKKKYLSLFLSLLLFAGVTSFPVTAEEVDPFEMTDDVYHYKFPKIDITELAETVKAFDKDRTVLDEFDGRPDFYKTLDGYSEKQYILLPDFVDTKSIKKGDYAISLVYERVSLDNDDTKDADGWYYAFQRPAADNGNGWESTDNYIRQYSIKPDWVNLYIEKEVGGIKVRGTFTAEPYVAKVPFAGGYRTPNPDYRKVYPEGTSVYRCFFNFVAYGYVYTLFTESPTPFDEQWENINLKVYAFSDGFLDLDENTTVYSRDHELLKGWYRIKGARYYFDENGHMAKGTVLINGREYVFGEDGKQVE